MKNILLIYCFLAITTSIFGKDTKLKNPTRNDLVCKKIKVIAGDNSPMVKLLEEMTNHEGESAVGSLIRCENSTSICYVISNAMTCHKK